MIATRALAGPLPLLAIALLILNDHVLKARVPGVATGKLSDLAGMVFFPLLLAAMAEHVGLRRRGTVAIAAVATGTVFAAIKLWAPAGDLYRVGLAALQWPFRALAASVTDTALPALGRAHLTTDLTDLVVLPALIVPVLLAGRTLTRLSRTEQDPSCPESTEAT